MAKIKFYKNMFESDFDIIDVESGTKLEDAINEYLPYNPYKTDFVECYDPDEDKVIFVPLENEEEPNVVISLNEDIISFDHIIQDTDIVTVIYIPASTGSSAVNAVAGFMGGVLGTFVGAVVGGLIFGIPGAFGGAIAGTVLGSWGFVQWAQKDPIGWSNFLGIGKGDAYASVSSSSTAINQAAAVSPDELQKIPSIRGASNQLLIGNSYPFVIGKQLISPFIVGNPITEYRGEFGKDAYISLLLCAGYSPLKLTDFRLDQTLLCYNRPHNNNERTLLNGTVDSKNILNIWNENDIKIEILQQHPDKPSNRGRLYTTTKIDKEIGANCLFVADKVLQDQAGVVYKGATFPTNFRNNNVYFSEACPKKLTLNLLADSGLFKTRSSGSDIEYGSIPIWYAIQYRYYNEDNAVSDANGSDYNSWKNFDDYYVNGKSIKSVYDSNKRDLDIQAHLGNDLSDQSINDKWIGATLFNFESCSGEKFNKQMRFVFTANLESTASQCFNMQNGVNKNSIKGVEVRIIRVSPCYLNERSGHEDKGPWNFSDMISVDTLVTEIFDEKKYREDIKVTCAKEASKGLTKISILPSDNITNSHAEVIIDNVKYTLESYSNTEITLSSPLQTVVKQNQIIIIHNKEVLPVYAIPNESDLDKFCYIAISAKADMNGYITNALQKVSCIAESFSPHWDIDTKEWLPKDISTRIKYVGYFDKNKVRLDEITNSRGRLAHDDARVDSSAQDAWEVELSYDDVPNISEEERSRLSMCELGRARREGGVRINPVTGAEERYGLNWLPVRVGSNYGKTIRRIVLNSDYLTPEAAIYNDNSSASGAMLTMVGPQSGLSGLGYENINLTSFGEWAEDSSAVKDGSTNIDGSPLEVRMCANGYIYKGDKLESLLAKITASGRAIYTYDTDGKIKAIMDKPVDYPVGVLSDQNCESSQNTYSYEDLPAGLSISFSDENDGYEQNSFFCWSDGNSYNHYKGQVIPYQIPFVTDPAQCWSLGRYCLANRILNRSVLVRKVGPEACVYEIGDVVIIQSSNLLIGSDSSGRVQQNLIINDKSYGIVSDSVYTCEKDKKMGITIVQSKYYGESNKVTEELAPIGSIITIDGVEYIQTEGLTNVALFKTPVPLNRDLNGEITNKRYDFSTSDVCLFGEYGQENVKYRIVKIKQDSPTSFTQTLLKYDENLYNYGAKLPSFQTFRRIPNVVKDPVQLSEVPKNLVELNNQTSANNDVLQQQINGLYANRVINLYRKSSSPLTRDDLPKSVLLYDFSKNTIKWANPLLTNDWKFTYDQALSDSGTMYFISATAFGKGITAAIPEADWTSPIAFGANGAPGNSGVNGYTVFAEISAITIPATDVKGTPKTFTVEDKIHVTIDGEDVDFRIGDTAAANSEIAAYFNFKEIGRSVIITGEANPEMPTQGFIKIPIFAKAVLERSFFVDENGQVYTDGEGNTYGEFRLSDSEVKYFLYVSFSKAAHGKGVNEINNYYLVSKLDYGITIDTEGWAPNPKPIPSPTKEEPYLWGYEETLDELDNIIKETTPRIITTYVEDGVGIDSIVDEYALNNESEDAPPPEDFNITIKVPTQTKRFLWNRETINYTNGKESTTTAPRVIGMYGEKGDKGETGARGPIGENGPNYLGTFLTHPSPAQVAEKGYTLVSGCWYLNTTDGFLYWYSPETPGNPWPAIKNPDGSTPVDDPRVKAAINDIMAIPSSNPNYTGLFTVTNAWVSNLMANTAFINKLGANKIKIIEKDGEIGAIYGGERYDENGKLVNPRENGFYLNTDGYIKGNLVGDNDNFIAGKSAGLDLVYPDYSGGDKTTQVDIPGGSYAKGTTKIKVKNNQIPFRPEQEIYFTQKEVRPGSKDPVTIEYGAYFVEDYDTSTFILTIKQPGINFILKDNANVLAGGQVGIQNTIIGPYAGQSISKGSWNICMGFASDVIPNTVSEGGQVGRNVVIGNSANSIGWNNVIIGEGAGCRPNTQKPFSQGQNVVIGDRAQVRGQNALSNVVIGHWAYSAKAKGEAVIIGSQASDEMFAADSYYTTNINGNFLHDGKKPWIRGLFEFKDGVLNITTLDDSVGKNR